MCGIIFITKTMEKTTSKNFVEKNIDWKGQITFSSIKIVGEEAEELERILSQAKNIPSYMFDTTLARLKSICDVREVSFSNKIVAVGREVFARRLINDLAYSGVINYGAVGTSTASVSDSDTALGTEIKRKGIATKSRTGTTVTLRFFYSRSDFNDTVEEFGTFIDGSASADSGQMFNRALTGGWVKSNLEALTVTVQFDLNPQP